MRCEELTTLLSGHLDGCNTPEQEKALQAHLETCENCRRTLEDFRKNDALLAGTMKEPPADFTANVMKAISVEVPKPKPQKKFPMRYATAIAAVAAVFLIVVSTGKISLPNAGTTAILPETAQPKAENQPKDLPQATLSASGENKSDSLHANVDCAALANAEGIPVAVLYTDRTPEVLSAAPSLSLSGGTRYTVSLGTLDALTGSYDLIRYEPENTAPSAEGMAYLIVIPTV